MTNIGLIGAGAWGKHLLRNFANLPTCNVKIVCDVSEKVRAYVSNTYPDIEVVSEFDKIVADPSIDAVVIATTPVTHFDLSRRALEAGKDVFVEKPLVLEVSEGRKLVELAEKTGKLVMVGHIMVYHPAILKLKELIDSGELGEIFYLYSARLNLGKVRDIENALWSFAPHDISVALFLLNKEPVSVTAVARSYLQKEKGIEDVSFMTMLFKEGEMANIHVSWLDPNKVRKLTVVGSKKMVVLDDTEASEKIRIYDKGVDKGLDYQTYGEYLSLRTGDIIIPKVDSSEPLRSECLHFIDCVEKRNRPRSDGAEGLKVLKILAAAQKSIDDGGVPVKL
ncbi:MAG: Gfo/Idh/MocA family oxidoreductase [candidate division Zixibacteria bacterium]|nr:Gfo/Idh/MocA family oxidoreductase [candidate division Zixibacteria bacterium]MBU1469680.1 Gfo/Idh/MocA family oxidoreductase [candidate division Zixibacteria bacterium]MBU2624749.1 Gfo/Idh/MocA family oxidoreductase [candidate division Zixibacteria bacterium]